MDAFWERHPRLKRSGWIAIHLGIVFHFFAIMVAPASVPPATPVAQQSWTWVRHYLEATFLNHGYHFFAPDPAGSTLISFSAKLPDGSVQWGRFPNHQIFPRLIYHRHFMLTEHMASTFEQRPDLRETLVRAYAGQIHRQTGAAEVVLSEVFHDLSGPADVRAGRPLDDPTTYTENWLGEYRWQTTDGE